MIDETPEARTEGRMEAERESAASAQADGGSLGPTTFANGPVILITGASSGIGRAAARRFAALGWRVFATMRAPEKGQSLRDEAKARGWWLRTPQLDVTDDDSVAAAVAALLAATGDRLDVVLNNAGYYVYGPLEETSAAELRAQLETNFVGVHRVTRAVLPALRARRAGRIVVIGSVSGLVALPVVGPYHSSKWALEAWTESLRYELAPFGIDVVLIEPGPFRTALHDNEVKAHSARAGDGPYSALTATYEEKSRRMRRAELPALIDVLERAVVAKRPRLRWPVGPTSFSAAYIRPLVPDVIYEWVIGLTFRWRRQRGRFRGYT